MILSSSGFGFGTIIVTYMITAMWHCNCGKDPGLKNPHTETRGLFFSLKDRTTGNDIYNSPTSVQPAPDSVKLIDLRTNFSYLLYLTRGASGSELWAKEYRRPAHIIDSLVFKFGNATLDTLVIHTGIVEGWRGDECPSVDEPGITKVILRNQVLVETTYDIARFTILK